MGAIDTVYQFESVERAKKMKNLVQDYYDEFYRQDRYKIDWVCV